MKFEPGDAAMRAGYEVAPLVRSFERPLYPRETAERRRRDHEYLAPVGEGHRDDHPGEALAENESRRHQQRGDDIEAHLVGAQAAQNLDHEHGERGNDTGDPDQVRSIGSAGNV